MNKLEIRRTIEMHDRERPFLNSFLKEGWVIVETLKTLAEGTPGSRDSIIFILGAPAGVDFPDDFEAELDRIAGIQRETGF